MGVESKSTDEPLTDIPGVGSKTAESLRELGYEDAYSLAVGYLTNDGRRIQDTLYDVGRWHRYVRELHIPNQALGIEDRSEVDLAGMMLLFRMHDAAIGYLAGGARTRSHIYLLNEDDFYSDTVIDGSTVRPGDIDWESPTAVTGDETMSYGPWSPAPDGDDYESAAECIEAEDDCFKFTSANYSVMVKRDKVDTATVLTGCDLRDAPGRVLLPDDDAPVRIDGEGQNMVRIAPFLAR